MAKLVGPSVKVVRAGISWPSIVDVAVADGTVRAAVHAGAFAKRSYRGRDDVERRMQNPGQDHPVRAEEGVVPIIIGLWEEEGRPVLVGFDAERRVGKTARQSFFGALPIRPPSALGRAHLG